jgi:manganese/zinc/iron transport system permease protein
MAETFWTIDFPALLVAILASILCSLLGSFLVLRKQAMMGDTLSHVILPGLALAFIFSGDMHIGVMMMGALGACLTAVLAIRFLQTIGRIEPGAAMGIVFTVMFACGIVLLETKVGSRVHLDAHHALYGGLELTYWPAPLSWETMPPQIKTLGGLLFCTVALIFWLFKELLLSSFDPLFAHTQGLSPIWVSVLLMVLVALAAVACFEAVGSILVIALFICPAAAARMISDNLKRQLWLSAAFGASSALLGYILASFLPIILGSEHALSAGGMIALSAGAIQLWAMLMAPEYGYFRKS